MTALRDALLARLAEIRRDALDATPGYARATLGPLVEGLAEEVGRHESVLVHPGWPMAGARGCRACHVSFGADPDCPFVLRWAERLGVAAAPSPGGAG